MMFSTRTVLRNARGLTAMIGAALMLSACSMLGSSGPSTRAVLRAPGKSSAAAVDIKVIDLNEETARYVVANSRGQLLSDVIGDGEPFRSVIQPGDVLDIAIWEAPPATLFGTAIGEGRLSESSTTSMSPSRPTSLPEQVVDSNGRITVPFIGAVAAAGMTPTQVSNIIVSRLGRMAHRPQAVVRIVKNVAANVTVVGEVNNSSRVPLSPRGERLLDILASSGGVKQAVGKVTIQVSRGGRVASLPLQRIISDPTQNIRLQADDIVTALFQPFSFTALGAVGNNAEIEFEGTGITLAQALGRIGGLKDERADAKGVFIFRLEDPAALDPALVQGARTTPDGRIPIIYRLDLRNPASFFIAQGFPIRNKDVVYVSNAPGVDLQKFVNIVSSMTFSVIGIANSL